MPSPTRLASTEARVSALAYAFNNADSEPMKAAAENLANGCPAFWHKAGGNSVPATFITGLNIAQDVKRAWSIWEASFGQPSRMRGEAMLDQLLPLNEMAVHSLLDAYAELDSFRSAKELSARVDRAESEAVDALRKLRADGGNATFPLDWSRVDEAARAVNRSALTPVEVAGAVSLADAMEAA